MMVPFNSPSKPAPKANPLQTQTYPNTDQKGINYFDKHCHGVCPSWGSVPRTQTHSISMDVSGFVRSFVRSFVEPSAPLRRLANAISAHAGRARAGTVHLGETKTVGRQGVKRERTNERSKYLGDGGGSGCAWICQKN